jgi:hypothetical protein
MVVAGNFITNRKPEDIPVFSKAIVQRLEKSPHREAA